MTISNKIRDLGRGFMIGSLAGALVLTAAIADSRKTPQPVQNSIEKIVQEPAPQKPIEIPESNEIPIQQLNRKPIEAPEPIPQLPPRNANSKNSDRLYEDLVRHEGVRKISYNDTKGIRTIGMGFNLEKEGARSRIEELGLDYRAVFNGTQELTMEQIKTLAREDREIARNDAIRYLGKKDWAELDQEAQTIMSNMSYNLGFTRLSKFKNLREALVKKDYQKAADEMESSRWYNQTGNRSRELVRRMRNIKN